MIRFSVTAGLLASLAAASPGHAQNAVPVQNVDEPGRRPHQQTVTNVVSGRAFPEVPAGYRLVVTYASAYAGPITNPVQLGVGAGLTSGPASSGGINLPNPVTLNGNYRQVGGAVTFYIDGPNRPVILFTGNVPSSVFQTFSVVGYLVPIPAP